MIDLSYNKVSICGIDTSKLPLIKEKDKNELLKKILLGDKNARNEMISGNLRLVLSVVQKFSNRGENPDDLFQVGCIGLIKAIDNFDISLNVRFSTYAVPMIIGEIRRYLRDNNPIRISRSIRDIAYKAMQAKEQLTNQLGREPKIEEISQYINLSKEEVVLALEAIIDPISLFEPIFSDDGDPIYVMDQVGDKSTDLDWIDEMNIKDTIQSFNGRDRKILTLRFLFGKTQMEVAEEIGISQAQVSRLEKNAINKIKGN